MSPKDRRALFIGLAVLGPALAYIYGVKPLLADVRSTREQSAEQRQLLAHEMAAVSAARRNPEAQRLADSAMRAMTPRLFEGRDDAMATAELLSHLGSLARNSNVALQSASTRPPTVINGVRALHVEIRGETDVTGLITFLESLETGEKLLRVDRLDVSRSLAGGPVKGVEPLAISAAIIGYAIPDPSAPAENPPRTPGRVPIRPPAGLPARGAR
jgi:hypothetical protein